jgi:hypothetical protein
MSPATLPRSADRVTPEELSVLFDPHSESNFHGVYLHRNRWRWTTPFQKRHRTGHDSPQEAARQLVRWWRLHFGARWPDYYRGRTAAPWVVRQDPLTGAWSLTIFVKGVPRPVPPPRRRDLADRADACRHLARWCRRRFGRDAWRVVRRTSPAPTAPEDDPC